MPDRHESFEVEIVEESFRPAILHNAFCEVLGTDFRWTEGPVWFADHQCLYFSDIPSDRIMRWDERAGVTVFREPAQFCNGHCRDARGRLISCSHGARAVLRTELDGSITRLADSSEGKSLNSPNDVALHPDGSLWFSDPPYGLISDYEGGKRESHLPLRLYRLSADGDLSSVMDVPDGPNGLGFSPDLQTFYLVVTGDAFAREPVQEVRAFDLSEDGSLSNERVIHKASKGAVDGIAIDEEGRLWCSCGSGVEVVAPEGELLARINLGQTVANLTFGGRANSRLFLCAGDRLLALYTNTRGA